MMSPNDLNPCSCGKRPAIEVLQIRDGVQTIRIQCENEKCEIRPGLMLDAERGQEERIGRLLMAQWNGEATTMSTRSSEWIRTRPKKVNKK